MSYVSTTDFPREEIVAAMRMSLMKNMIAPPDCESEAAKVVSGCKAVDGKDDGAVMAQTACADK